MQDPNQRIEPVDVEVHVDRRLMQVRWSDGHDAVYDFEFLRWQCPCAECRGEGGLPGVLAQTTALRPEQTEMTDLHVVGRAGTLERAESLITSSQPDVLLLDHRLPDGDGVTAIPRLRSLRPSMAIVVLTLAVLHAERLQRRTGPARVGQSPGEHALREQAT